MNTSGKNNGPSKKKKKPTSFGRARMTRLMLERMREIHFLIYTETYPNSPSLGIRFNVSEKTIDRDIEMMRERFNLPIETDRAKGGYYYNGNVAMFPDVLLTEGELISMVLATSAAQSSIFADLGKPAQFLMEKLNDCLPKNISINLEEWERAISFHYFGEPKFDPAIFRQLITAIAERRQLIMVYATPDEPPGERVMEPYGMAFINREWVMFAFDYKRAEIRRFIPPRMSEVRETGKTFVRPADFRVEDHLKDTFGPYNSDKLYDVVIQFKPKLAHETRERHWPDNHRLEHLPDGSVNVHMKLSHLHDIHRWVLSWNAGVFPIAPVELRQQYLTASQEMQENFHASAEQARIYESTRVTGE